MNQVKRIIRSDVRGIYHTHLIEDTTGNLIVGNNTIPAKIGSPIDLIGEMYRGHHGDLNYLYEGLVETNERYM
jgi:hypothetical protein